MAGSSPPAVGFLLPFGRHQAKKEALTRLDEQALDNFCHTLVDYLSSGHFSLYQRLIAEMDGTSPLLAAAQIYPSLEANTEQLMQLYDGHLQQAIDDDNYVTFQHALSEVGEALEARFTLESKWHGTIT